jgi:hypothetical protein
VRLSPGEFASVLAACDPQRAKAALASIFGERVTLEPDESGHSRAWKLHRIQVPFRA